MHYKLNLKPVAFFILGIALCLMASSDLGSSAIAQGRPPGGPGGFGGGFGGPDGRGRGRGGMMGGPGRRSEKMRLGGFLRGISELERAKKTPLNKQQAQKIVATIAPWRKKAAMSEADAKKLSIALHNTLTAAQKTALQTMRPPRPQGFGQGRAPGGRSGERPDGPPRGERPDGPPPGGFGGPPPGGFGRGLRGERGERPAPPTQAQMKKMETFMKTFNPFYPPTSYKQLKELPRPMQEGVQRRYKETQAALAQLVAKAKK